jgi:hypothetical protein
MPTTERRRWCIPLAVDWFQRQSYDGPLELVIVTEDYDEVAGALPWDDDRITLGASRPGDTLGEKHNICAEFARYPWLAKWDDDDWQSPIRLERTMRAARNANALMVSAEPLLFYELGRGRCYEHTFQLAEPWQPGNSLLFARELWEARPFRADRECGIDVLFVMDQLKACTESVIVNDAPLTVVMKHGQKTGMKVWDPAPPDFRLWNGDLAGLLGADLERFEEAFCQKST